MFGRLSFVSVLFTVIILIASVGSGGGRGFLQVEVYDTGSGCCGWPMFRFLLLLWEVEGRWGMMMDGIDADVSLAHGIANFVVNGLVWTGVFFFF